MKHHILIEFHTTKPLPADFTDIVAGRIYIMDIVDKRECNATILNEEEVCAIWRAETLKETE